RRGGLFEFIRRERRVLQREGKRPIEGAFGAPGPGESPIDNRSGDTRDAGRAVQYRRGLALEPRDGELRERPERLWHRACEDIRPQIANVGDHRTVYP